MNIASDALYFALRPSQLWMMIQLKRGYGPIPERDEKHDSESARVCFKFLDQTGRSYARVIKALHPDLVLPVCVFYLTLRGLDTIEDDTSIPLETKEPLLRNFVDHLDQDGWTFNGNRLEEKDRELLVQFDNVITEFKNMKPAYQAIIKEEANEMGNGMADFVRKAALGDVRVNTIEEYDLYCWYVAGIVGEGLTRLFIEAKLGEETLLNNSHLYRSMGLMLQKTNIIRDIREDRDDGRFFWPKEIWSKHVDDFEDLFEAENLDQALNCSSDMVLNALGHAIDCLTYLAGLREQSVFNFCAIPQCMAIATLELCFRNPALFERNIKVSRRDTIRLMLESSQGLASTCKVFCRYLHAIQRKNDPRDPNFSKINDACKKIETYATTLSSQRVTMANDTGRRGITGRLFVMTVIIALLAMMIILLTGPRINFA